MQGKLLRELLRSQRGNIRSRLEVAGLEVLGTTTVLMVPALLVSVSQPLGVVAVEMKVEMVCQGHQVAVAARLPARAVQELLVIMVVLAHREVERMSRREVVVAQGQREATEQVQTGAQEALASLLRLLVLP